MRTRISSTCAVLAVTSDTAFLDLRGIPILVRSYQSLDELFPEGTILIACPSTDAPQVRGLLKEYDAKYKLLTCQPLDPSSFSQALAPSLENFESVLIHDASRPLVRQEQFERVLSALTQKLDAVRPAIAFTETLKILGPNSEIKETLDRNSVKRVSTPELIRTSAIRLSGRDTGWFLPLKEGAHIEYVEGTTLGLRVNTKADRDLMELFLD